MTSPEEIHLSLIVARTRNGVIGNKGKMPWRIPSELAHFKRTTLGKPVLMGRKTWDSLHVQPLPQRENLVLTHKEGFCAPGAECFSDFETMLARARTLARKNGGDEVIVIGGAMLYGLALPRASRVYLTEIDADIPGDVWFDDLEKSQWHLLSIDAARRGQTDEYRYFVKIFDRICRPDTAPATL